ncbi:Zdhhc3 [Symbiodinium sp. KB8]|nr:Zdhhc3 [Symbiodinium sp. KB8]
MESLEIREWTGYQGVIDHMEQHVIEGYGTEMHQVYKGEPPVEGEYYFSGEVKAFTMQEMRVGLSEASSGWTRQTLEMLLDRSENAPGEPGDNDRHPHVGVTDCVEYVGQAGIKWLELLNMCQGTMTIQGDTEMWMMGEVPRLLLRDLGRAATCYMVCCGYLWGWDYGNSGGRDTTGRRTIFWETNDSSEEGVPAGSDGRAARSNQLEIISVQNAAVKFSEVTVTVAEAMEEEGVDAVAAGRPLLPEYAAAMVTETVANYNGHDRAISTVAFVRFLRTLMQEVMSAFERGVAAGGAQERNEDELGRQSPATRNANIDGVRARLERDGSVLQSKREALLAFGGDHESQGPWISRAIRIPCSRRDGPVTIRMDCHMEDEVRPAETVVVPQDPCEADTLPLPAAVPQDPGEADTLPLPAEDNSIPGDGHGPEVAGGLSGTTCLDSMDRENKPMDTVENSTLRDIEWSDYQDLYDKWKNGRNNDQEIVVAGGKNLLDLMEAQFISDMESQPPLAQENEVGDNVNLGPSSGVTSTTTSSTSSWHGMFSEKGRRTSGRSDYRGTRVDNAR